MRNIKNYVVAACALLLLDGCDFLDYDETSGKTKEAYAYFENMNRLVAYVYRFLPSDLGSGYIMESATDNLYLYTGKCQYLLHDDRCMESLKTCDGRLGLLGPLCVVPILSLRILTLKC